MTDTTISPAANGVYRAPAAPDALRERVVGAGLAWHVVDVSRARTKRAILSAWARALRFPESYGRNWDALADCLQDLSWDEAAGCIVWLHGFGASSAAAADYAVLLEILDTTAVYWRQRRRVFIVWADGESDLPAFVLR